MRMLIKIIVTALLVTGISELGRCYRSLAAILASLPLTSILAMIWLYLDMRDALESQRSVLRHFPGRTALAAFFHCFALAAESRVEVPAGFAGKLCADGFTSATCLS